MNLREISCTIFGTLLVSSLSMAEPTITPSGSIQVTGEVNNGKSSYRSETNLSLEINFTDNVTGYFQATNDSSNDQSSAKIHQAFLVLAGTKTTQGNENKTESPIFSNKRVLTDKEITKIVRAESAKLFPVLHQESIAKISDRQEKTKPNPSNSQTRSIQLASK